MGQSFPNDLAHIPNLGIADDRIVRKPPAELAFRNLCLILRLILRAGVLLIRCNVHRAEMPIAIFILLTCLRSPEHVFLLDALRLYLFPVRSEE